MSDLGNRTNVNTAINLLLDDAQPNEAIQPSDHNTLLQNILDTLANGLSVTLRTNPETGGQDIEITSGDKLKYKSSTFFNSLVSATLTADRTLTFPDKTDTIATLTDVQNIMNTNGLILGGNYTHDLNSNNLVFDDGSFRLTNGSLGVLGSFNATHDGATGQDVATFISSSANPIMVLSNTYEAVAIGTTGPSISAILDIESTSKGVLFPRMTTTQRNAISTPAESMFIYNTTDNQFEFRSSGGTWDALGGGGASIYTADGTISATRSVNLDTKIITFDAGTTTSSFNVGLVIDARNIFSTASAAPSVFKILGLSGNPVFTVHSRGYPVTKSDYTGVIAQFENRAGTQGLNLSSGTSQIASNGFRHIATNSDITDRIDQNVTNVYQQWVMVKNNVKNHWLRNGDTLAQASFFIDGFSGKGFNVGAGAPIGTENISLQGHTIIKGAGTTTGTTLALYDNQGTPAKTWEWLDNGSVNIGQDSVFNLNTHKLEFKDSTGANSLLILDDNTRSKISSTNASTFMQYAGSSTTGKITVTSSAVTVNSAFFQSKNEAGTHIALDINNNSTNGKISINNSVGTQMEWTNDKVGITSSATRIVRNNVIRAFFADAFTIFGSDNTTTINGEDISLQGDVLMNANVNMSNLPTSATGLVSGDIYNDGGTLKIV